MSDSAHILAIDDDPLVPKLIADYRGDNEMRVTGLPSGRTVRVMGLELGADEMLTARWR